jgi:hypothetical protein
MKQICQLSRPPAAFIVLIPECKLVATGCINREAMVCGDPGGSSSGGACQCVNLGTNSKFDQVAVGLVGVNWGQLPTSTHPCFSLFDQLACPRRNSQIHEQVEPHGSATSHAIFSSVICPLSLVLVHTINRIASIKCQIETLFFTLLFT